MMMSASQKWPTRTKNLKIRIGAVAFVLGVSGMAGCNKLLDVSVPGNIEESRLDDPALADLLTRSVISAWECSLTQHAGATGLLGTELSTSSNFGSRDNFDNRIADTVANSGATSTCPGGAALYSSSGAQYVAMALGRDITRRYEAWTDAQLPKRTLQLATVTIYAAYAMSIFGEGYCNAVLEANGPALKPLQVDSVAESWFTKGLAYAISAADVNLQTMAYAGRARMRLYRGDMAGAIADAQKVPAGFVQYTTYGATPLTRVNRIWGETWRDKHNTVHPSFYNLTVDGVPDNRVQVQDMKAKGVDGVIPSWNPVKYNLASSSIRMASWEEAQLIIAEASLGQTAVDRINAIRTKRVLPLFKPKNVNDTNEILNQVIEERRRELFLEGHWLADMIRHKGRPGTAFDEGLNQQRITEYRPLYCIPLPDREINNNPNVHL
jgi:hypothetical protein